MDSYSSYTFTLLIFVQVLNNHSALGAKCCTMLVS